MTARNYELYHNINDLKYIELNWIIGEQNQPVYNFFQNSPAKFASIIVNINNNRMIIWLDPSDRVSR